VATEVARLRAYLDADTRDFDRAMGRSETKTERFGRVAKTALIGGAAAGLYAFGKAAQIGWNEYNQGQRVAAQTNAVIKSTGGVANVSAEQVEKLGTALMLKSGIDDEVIKSGENVLLTFRNIRNETGKNNDIFNQATELTTDLSVAMGRDLNSSAVLVGKALNDPIRGVTSLTRVGVQFNDQQRAMIERLTESGRTMEAQKIVLRELSKEFGGSAEAAGDTFGGQINIARERLNNFLGLMVEKAIPYLQRFVKWIGPYAHQALELAKQGIEVVQKATDRMGDTFRRHQDTVDKLTKVLGFLWDVYVKLWKVQLYLMGIVFRVWARILEVVLSATDKIIAAFQKVIRFGQRVYNLFLDAKDAVSNFFQSLWNGLQRVLGPLEKLGDIFGGIKGAISGAAGAVGGLFGDGMIGAGIGAFAGAGAQSISPTLFDDLALAQSSGLTLTSGYRPGAVTSTGNPSLHGVFPSKAIDVSGSETAMRRFFLTEVARGALTGLREVIHSPFWWHPGSGITRIPSSAGSVLRDHYSHVHVGSYDQGGFLRPGWNLAYNGLGRPEPVGMGNVTLNYNTVVGDPRDGDKILRLLEDWRRRGGR